MSLLSSSFITCFPHRFLRLERTCRMDPKFQTGLTGGNQLRNINKTVFQVSCSWLRNTKSRVCVDDHSKDKSKHPSCHLSSGTAGWNHSMLTGPWQHLKKACPCAGVPSRLCQKLFSVLYYKICVKKNQGNSAGDTDLAFRPYSAQKT